MPDSLSWSDDLAHEQSGSQVDVAGVMSPDTPFLHSCPDLSPSSNTSLPVQEVDMARTKQTAQVDPSDPKHARPFYVSASELTPYNPDTYAELVRDAEEATSAERTVSEADQPEAEMSGQSNTEAEQAEAGTPSEMAEEAEEAEMAAGDGIADPTLITIEGNWFNYLVANTKAFKKSLRLGSGYRIKIPTPSLTICEGCIPVYAAMLEAGVRFPLHPFIAELLRAYDLGIAQLTPNSWHNVVSFLAVCELNGVPASVNAFIAIHNLLIAPKSREGCCLLSNKSEYVTAYNKPSKYKNWRSRFIYIKCSDSQEVERLSRWNPTPNFFGRSSIPPRLSSEEWDFVDAHFHVPKGEEMRRRRIALPKHWLPDPDYFKDSVFLAAVGLSSHMDKGSSAVWNLCSVHLSNDTSA